MIRTRYSDFERVRFTSKKPSRTKQNHKGECDINQIIKKFQKTGQLEHVKTNPQIYGNFTDPITYHDAMNLVSSANQQFEGLSSAVRERFDNNPAKFLEFATNGRNAEEMAQMGLMDPKSVERVETAKKAKSAASKNPDMGGGKDGSPEAKS